MTEHFFKTVQELKEYLQKDKVFIDNPARLADVQHATEIANELFGDMNIWIKEDPIQMGALILCIEGFDIIVRGEREIELFYELIDKANNFEIYATEEGNIRCSILFNKAKIRIK